MCSLICYISKDIMTLSEALSKMKNTSQNGYALLYGRTECVLAELKAGKLVNHTDDCTITDVYEARVFTKNWELRWLEDSRIAVLTEAEEEILEGEWDKNKYTVETDENHYMLWGKGAGVFTNGWGGVSSARIGTIPLPFEVQANRYVQLNTREYFSNDYPCGNFAVFDERLISLEVKRDD